MWLAFVRQWQGSKAWLHGKVKGEVQTIERDLGTVSDSESSGSSCDDSPNLMEERVEDFEMVEQEEAVEEQRVVGEGVRGQ
ncbi:hypothetical protein D8674_009918 [Pyrus ussuriensis x Pyrus communis]|uniref:Uncharacterized protein n=1 Tax=Pyrus ussuriensis x Pyrus communis TaxID=2448454 RepID=A0A5N5F9M5_9ROSA|nr:hypothetical protein D8674_009918 [Pyrus ussuriensis x Pyrus communis]